LTTREGAANVTAGEGRVGDADLLSEVLRLAQEEGALEGEALVAFARALRERADLILQERVRALEEESAWRREAMAGLETRAAGLAAERENAMRAHEQLLAHHRDVLAQVVGELRAVAALPLVRMGQVRRRMAALADLLRKELP
jgi:hypothetical protein